MILTVTIIKMYAMAVTTTGIVVLMKNNMVIRTICPSLIVISTISPCQIFCFQSRGVSTRNTKCKKRKSIKLNEEWLIFLSLLFFILLS